jgi:pyruvate dehydrogenase E2 component (dihydrolipoamide acetyltransferase)
VLTDAEGNDTIAIRSTQHFTLGFDHRIIDGADACKFMSELKKTLEGWDKEIG